MPLWLQIQKRPNGPPLFLILPDIQHSLVWLSDALRPDPYRDLHKHIANGLPAHVALLEDQHRLGRAAEPSDKNGDLAVFQPNNVTREVRLMPGLEGALERTQPRT